jgi:DNA-binding NtrC family response regulator
VVAATSVELQRAIGEGRFREDLYHRLAVISLELPPLRTRGGDILELAEHFLTRACADYGLSARTLTPAARDRLVAYRWPGTVRELANTLERVALLSTTDEITATMLDFLAGRLADGPDTGGSTAPGSLDDNVLRALAPLPRAAVPRPSRPQPRTPQPRWSRRHRKANGCGGRCSAPVEGITAEEELISRPKPSDRVAHLPHHCRRVHAE